MSVRDIVVWNPDIQRIEILQTGDTAQVSKNCTFLGTLNVNGVFTGTTITSTGDIEAAGLIKSGGTVVGAIDSGTATSVGALTITQTGKAWATNVFATGAVVSYLSGTNSAVADITANNADSLTLAAGSSAPDAGTTFTIFGVGSPTLAQVLINGNISTLDATINKLNAGAWSMPAISANIPALNYVDVAFFDNSKDAAQLDKESGTSWYNETVYTGKQYVQTAYANDAAALAANPSIVADDIYFKTGVGFVLYSTGTTIYRAGSKKRPMRGFATAEADRVIIWDSTGATPTMWGVWTSNGWAMTVNAVTMKERVLVISRAGSGVCTFDFVADRPESRVAGGGIVRYVGLDGLAAIHNAVGNYSSWTTGGIVNSTVNDVAITYLDDAPLDEYGMRKPTIAVATAGGLSQISHDGNVWDWTDNVNYSTNLVEFTEDNKIAFVSAFTEGFRFIRVHNIMTADLSGTTYYSKQSGQEMYSRPASAGSPHTLSNPDIRTSAVAVDLVVDGTDLIIGGTDRLTRIIRNPATPAAGAIEDTTNVFSSGSQWGGIRRCYLANSKTVDRSVKAATLVENGTVTETVNTGGVNHYGPYTAANYFSEAYSADLDFGTAGFSFAAWVKLDATASDQVVFDRSSAGYTNQRIAVYKSSTHTMNFLTDDLTTTDILASGVLATGAWVHVAGKMIDGVKTLYINGVAVATSTPATNNTLSNATGLFWVGSATTAGVSVQKGLLALVRISATAPTAEQIAFMYQQEKPLFETGALCLLSNSASVSALAYDDSTDVLSVGNGTAVDQFKGLKRLSTAAHGVTTLTALASGSGEKVVVGTGGSFSAPARDINSELKILNQNLAEAKQGSELHSFATGAGVTTYTLPQGWKAVGPRWNITDGTFAAVVQTFDGFRWTLTGLAASKTYNVTMRRV